MSAKAKLTAGLKCAPDVPDGVDHDHEAEADRDADVPERLRLRVDHDCSGAREDEREGADCLREQRSGKFAPHQSAAASGALASSACTRSSAPGVSRK